MSKSEPDTSSKKERIRGWDKYFGQKLTLVFYGTLIASVLPAATCVVTIFFSIPEEAFRFLFAVVLFLQILMVFLFRHIGSKKRIVTYLLPQLLMHQSIGREGAVGTLEVEAFDARTAITVLEKLDLVNARLRRIFSNTQLLFIIMGLELIAFVSLSSSPLMVSSLPHQILILALVWPFPLIGTVVSFLKMKPEAMLVGYLAVLQFYEHLSWTEEEAIRVSKYPSVRELDLKRKRDTVRGVRNYFELLIRRLVPSFDSVNLDETFCNFALALDLGSSEQKASVKAFAINARNYLVSDVANEAREGFRRCLDELIIRHGELGSLSNLGQELKPTLGKPREEINLKVASIRFALWFVSIVVASLIYRLLVP